MKKEYIEVNDESKNNNSYTSTFATFGIIAAISVISGIVNAKLYSWKTNKFSIWKLKTNFYDDIEEGTTKLRSMYVDKIDEIVGALIKKYYEAPTKKSATKYLDIIDEFGAELKDSDKKSEKVALIMEYAAKYIDKNMNVKIVY